jgi:hypothetical protein
LPRLAIERGGDLHVVRAGEDDVEFLRVGDHGDDLPKRAFADHERDKAFVGVDDDFLGIGLTGGDENVAGGELLDAGWLPGGRRGGRLQRGGEWVGAPLRRGGPGW